MPKIIKIFLKGGGIILETMLILFILMAFLIRNSKFQTYVAQQASGYFSKEWKTKVSIDKVDISFFDNIYLEGVLLNDQKGKKMIAVKSLEVSIEDFGFSHLSIRQITLNGGEVWIYKEKTKGVMNFEFLATYFSSDDKTTKSKPFTLQLKALKLINTAFRYDDFRIAPSSYGLDPNHVYLQNLHLSLSKFKFGGPMISCHIDDLKMKDITPVYI
ncbi:MAG: hypothetical protein EBS34_08890 [Flavobacteriales bacterium]|nr:hypothetical protein [Flavobacteriales bacterium]